MLLEHKDSFYKYHNSEELELAHANLLDFDHPDAIDMPMFAAVREDSCIIVPTYALFVLSALQT